MAGEINPVVSSIYQQPYTQVVRTASVKELSVFLIPPAIPEAAESSKSNNINQQVTPQKKNEAVREDFSNNVAARAALGLKSASGQSLNVVKNTVIGADALRRLMTLAALQPEGPLTLTQGKGILNSLMLYTDALPSAIKENLERAMPFRGPLFDRLRAVLRETPDPAVRQAAGQLLKAFHERMDVLRSTPGQQNLLQQLRQNLAAVGDEELADELDKLMTARKRSFTLDGRLAPANHELSAQESPEFISRKTGLIEPNTLLPTLREILAQHPEDGAIKSDILVLLRQFLAISEDGDSAVSQAMEHLLQLAPKLDTEEMRSALTRALTGGINQTLIGKDTVSDQLVKLMADALEHNRGNDSLKETCEQLLRGMTAANDTSPTLIHLLLPVVYQNTPTYGELWIDNDRTAGKNKTGGVRMLLCVDIPDVGRFEADILLNGRRVVAHAYCPPALQEEFIKLDEVVRSTANSLGLTAEKVTVSPLYRHRELSEVFGKTFERRLAIDVQA